MPYLSTNVLDGLFAMDPMQLANWGIAGGLASQGPSIGINLGTTLNAQAEMQAAQMQAIKAGIENSNDAALQKQQREEEEAKTDQLEKDYKRLLQLSKADPQISPEQVSAAREAWLKAIEKHREGFEERRPAGRGGN